MAMQRNLHQEEDREQGESVSHGPFSSTRARREKRGDKKRKAAECWREECPAPAHSSPASVPGAPALPSRYLLQPSVLDVQLLGVDKVKELPILLPAGWDKEVKEGG